MRCNLYSQCIPKPEANISTAQPGETASLPHHLLDRGLMQGKHSDIVVKVFDRKYNLHRIILDRAPFFASALSPPWCEASQKEVELHPEDIDTNITQRAFELALKRLYGCSLRAEEDEEAVCLFATGCWLEMQDLICDSMTAIMRRLGPPNLAPVIQVVSANYYGKPGDKILESAKAMLCRNGADMAISTWDGVPIDLVRELVGSDAFFVKDEWSRWRLAKRLLDRRLKAVAREAGLWTSHSCQAPIEIRDRAIRPKPAIVEEALARIAKDDLTAGRQWEGLYSHSDVRPLLELLDEDVYYVHMDFEQLQAARNARDVFGVPVLLESTIQDALWSNLELRQKVLNSAESGLSIGLQQYDATDMAEDSVAPTSSRVASKRPFNSSSERNTPLALQSSSVGSNRHYSIPSTDCNIVLGGSDERAHTTRTIDSPRNPHTTSHLVTTSDDTEHTEASSLDIDTTSSSNETTPKVTPPTYSTYPPYRFAVELPSARVLKDRRKFFSHTVFYAGSHWNVYIKKVKNGAKNPHLGVYLHRAPRQQKSTPATSPSQGAVDRRIGALEQRMHHRGNRIYHRPPYPAAHIFNQDNPAATWTFNMPQYNTTAAARIQQQAQQSPIPNIDTYSSAAVMTGPGPHMPTPSSPADPYMAPYNATSFSSSSDDENTSPTHPPADLESLTYQPSHPQVPTLGAYVDKRPTIKTYFKIFSPSRGGRVLSVYESVPCDFNFSQSWGWKSSSLMADDENDDDEIEEILPVGETSFVADGDGVGAAEEGKGGDRLGKESSRRHGFRFCVVLGVV